MSRFGVAAGELFGAEQAKERDDARYPTAARRAAVKALNGLQTSTVAPVEAVSGNAS